MNAGAAQSRPKRATWTTDSQTPSTAGQGVGALQAVAVFEELHAAEDADREADEPDDGVEVAAGDPQNHAQRAAEEDERGDHDERAEHEAGHRRGAAAGEELLLHGRDDERAEHEADDFRADVLDDRRLVHPDRTGGVADEAGDAEAHVFGVPEPDERGGDDADGHAGEDDVTFFLQCQHLKADLIRMRFFCYYSTNIWHMEIVILNKQTVFIDIVYIYGAGGKSGVQ